MSTWLREEHKMQSQAHKGRELFFTPGMKGEGEGTVPRTQRQSCKERPALQGL